MMDRPTLGRRIGSWLRRVFGRSAAEPAASPARLHDPPTARVSLVIYDPRVNGQKLTQALGWNDPDRLAAALIDDLREASHGYANYKVAERIEIDAFPVKKDGFQYTAGDYLSRIRAGQGFHQPDAVDYERVLAESSLVEKINSSAIDEVWTISFPWAGFYESRMAGPGAFWCNAPPLEGTGANRRFVIMAFNYERGVGEMLESYGHRAESILGHVFRNIPEPDNLWKRFTRHEKTHPGQAEVGNIHFAPNSRRDYDWGNNTPVLTRFNAWRNFPDLSGEPVRAESRAWGRGDIREHHRWWFSLLPHVAGSSNGISHNWWEYIVDPNRVQ